MGSEVSEAVLRGYEVTVICVACVCAVAVGMCVLTWRFRYKIVLRTVSLFISSLRKSVYFIVSSDAEKVH